MFEIPIPLVYIAGPYYSPDKEVRRQNTEIAMLAAEMVVSEGALPIVPHLTGFNLEHVRADEPFWNAATMALLQKCDAMLVVGEWENSDGTIDEIHDCHERWRPCFELSVLNYLPPEFLQWLEDWRLRHPSA